MLVALQFYILAMGNTATKEVLLSQVTRESFIEARIRGNLVTLPSECKVFTHTSCCLFI